MKWLRIPQLFFVFGLLWPTSQALACPDGQYNACVLGVCACMPNSGTVVIALNPIPDTLNILGGIVQGDVTAISQGVGGLVIKSSCPGCAVAGQTILSSNDKAFAEAVIGRGWLVFLATGNPALVLVDASTSLPRTYALTRPRPNPLINSPPPPRGEKRWRTNAGLCAVNDGAGSVAIGWVEPPTFTDLSNNQTSTYPTIDVRENDIVEFTVTGEGCPPVPPGQSLMQSGTVRVSYTDAHATPVSTAMKYFVFGAPAS